MLIGACNPLLCPIDSPLVKWEFYYLGTEYAKWPLDADFPAFIGISFTQCDDDEEGHGLLIRRLSYWKHESAPGWRQDRESVLFRMWYKAEDLERPADASERLRSGLNKQFVQLR